MRFSFIHPALEDETLWDELEYPTEISTEDEEVMIDEANALAAEINTELNEASTGVRVADSFEDVAIVASNIEEATPAETQLIQIAGDLAAASADDVTGDDLVPATEAYIGRRVSVESFRDNVHAIWNKIKAWLKSVWGKIEKWFYNIFGQIPRMRKNIEAARKRIEKIEDDGLVIGKDNNTFEVIVGISGLMKGNTPVKKASELKEAYKNSVDAVNFVVGTKAITDIGKIVADEVGKYEPANQAEADSQLKSIVSKITDKAKSVSLPVAAGTKWPGFTVMGKTGLLGGKALVYRFRGSASKGSALQDAEAIRTTRMEFTTLDVKEVKTPDSVKFATMSTSEMTELLDKVDSLLDNLERFHRGQGRKDIMKAKDEIAKASDKLEGKAGKVDEDKERELLPYLRAVYKLNMMYTSIASAATTGAYNHAISASKTVLAMVSRSCSQYKKQD